MFYLCSQLVIGKANPSKVDATGLTHMIETPLHSVHACVSTRYVKGNLLKGTRANGEVDG